MAEVSKGRPEIKRETLDRVYDAMVQNLLKGINKHGAGTWKSSHEILGLMTEEYHELIQAVHTGDRENLIEELKDIGTVVLFGLASLYSEHLDW